MNANFTARKAILLPEIYWKCKHWKPSIHTHHGCYKRQFLVLYPAEIFISTEQHLNETHEKLTKW